MDQQRAPDLLQRGIPGKVGGFMRSHIGRLIWVLLTNGTFICLAALGYSHEADLQHMLHPDRSVSLLHLLTSDFWGAIAVLALLLGIVLEATWSRAGAVVNCAYYLVALVAGIWGIWKDKNLVPSEHVTAGLVLYLVPVFIIALVDIWLYRKDLPGSAPAPQ
jgi:hypothetical protein